MNNDEHGFSAVELLITLFIAAIFLTSGYLLWSYTQRNGAESYQTSIASNIAYDYLRRYDSSATCNTTPINNATPDSNTAGLPNPKITVTITCPMGAGAGLVKVKSTVSYGANPTRTISQVVYAN